MQEETKRILDMVENGVLTAQEAKELLEVLGNQSTVITPEVKEELKKEHIHPRKCGFYRRVKKRFYGSWRTFHAIYARNS